MKRALLALLILAAPLCAAEEPRWQQVLLFDWVYPGEAGYDALKAAALQAGSNDWLVARMNQNEKLPQASAKELAFKLSHDAKVAPELQDKLKKIFPDEPELLQDKGDASAPAQAAAISTQFDAMSKRMDEIEALFDKNRYGKGSFPAADINIWSGYQLFSPAGSIQNDSHGYSAGGINITLRGTLDKANYTLTIAESYDPANLNGAGNNYDYSARQGTVGDGFSFLLPLDTGGLEVHLGDSVPINFSPLLFSAINPSTNSNFFVDVSQSYRPPTDIKELDLGYPAGAVNRVGLVIKKQGAVWYWPFTASQFVYSPDTQYFESFDPKINAMGLRLDEDFGPKGSLIDDMLIYGVAVNAENDADELVPTGTSINDPQKTDSYSLGGTLLFSSGTSLSIEGALSHYEKNDDLFPENYSGSAYLGNLTLPLGPVYLAFESGMASPYFLTRDIYPDWRKDGGELDRYQTGSTLDSTYFDPLNPDPFQETRTWVSLVKDTSILSNNTDRNVLKLEWHGSFVSMGLYDGAINQISASGPYVVTSPYLEGSAGNGYGWFALFGQQYAPAPAPFSAAPGPLLNGGNALGSQFGNYNQWVYNSPTDGYAINSAGSAQPVHWQEISQQSYKEGEFTLLLSQKGVGDNNVMPDSVKTINYAGGTIRFDLKGLLNRTLPMDLVVLGEDRDLAANLGVPSLGPDNFFNQQYVVGFFTLGLTSICNVLATAGYETWRSNHSYYPLDIQTKEYGLGTDVKLDPLLSGLALNLRASLMQNEDLFIGSRDFSLWNLNIGSTLSY
jgi:hypothetical protein